MTKTTKQSKTKQIANQTIPCNKTVQNKTNKHGINNQAQNKEGKHIFKKTKTNLKNHKNTQNKHIKTKRHNT